MKFVNASTPNPQPTSLQVMVSSATWPPEAKNQDVVAAVYKSFRFCLPQEKEEGERVVAIRREDRETVVVEHDYWNCPTTPIYQACARLTGEINHITQWLLEEGKITFVFD